MNITDYTYNNDKDKDNFNLVLKDLKDIEKIQYDIQNLLLDQSQNLDLISNNMNNINQKNQLGLNEIKDCNKIQKKNYNILLFSSLGFLCFGPVGGLITGVNTTITSGIVCGLIGGYLGKNGFN